MSIRKRKWRTRGKLQREAWVVDYFDQHGRRHLKTFSQRRDAVIFYNAIDRANPALPSARHATRKMIDDLNWRGPTGRTMGHVVLSREMAQSLLAVLPTQLLPSEAKP